MNQNNEFREKAMPENLVLSPRPNDIDTSLSLENEKSIFFVPLSATTTYIALSLHTDAETTTTSTSRELVKYIYSR